MIWQIFVETRDTVERLRKAEEKKATQAASKELLKSNSMGPEIANPKKPHHPVRRSSAIVTSHTQVHKVFIYVNNFYCRN